MKLLRSGIVFVVVFAITFLLIPVGYTQNIPAQPCTPKNSVDMPTGSSINCPLVLAGKDGKAYNSIYHSGSLIMSYHKGASIAHNIDILYLGVPSLVLSILAGLVTYAILDSSERRKRNKSDKLKQPSRR